MKFPNQMDLISFAQIQRYSSTHQMQIASNLRMQSVLNSPINETLDPLLYTDSTKKHVINLIIKIFIEMIKMAVAERHFHWARKTLEATSAARARSSAMCPHKN